MLEKINLALSIYTICASWILLVCLDLRVVGLVATVTGFVLVMVTNLILKIREVIENEDDIDC